ncbi:helix-turn-helix domain-containing protein [Haliangium ochraceum]|uniref:DNA binding domain protein, excisionase family n=1 Tax=Haliangium ochraceum (strain DSM 14365 / JCM 11303 / SMP-2) TaxID=502025 RepID=D0LR27_HALO1|nr:helix-turn-helix domain-containing protein [Haliangium ochraceum]ACY15535.1 DNA binding domain protein, excisionase family [Haliangium ochraceum DSM 14365]
MSEEMLSIQDVAEILGLHVKTVRGYVRDGRLAATRIGKQYRITRAQLAAFTGQEPAPEVPRARHVEVSSIVQIDAIDQHESARISNTLLAMAQSNRDRSQALRIESVYDEQRGSLKIIVIGSVEATGVLLQQIAYLL